MTLANSTFSASSCKERLYVCVHTLYVGPQQLSTQSILEQLAFSQQHNAVSGAGNETGICPEHHNKKVTSQVCCNPSPLISMPSPLLAIFNPRTRQSSSKNFLLRLFADQSER